MKYLTLFALLISFNLHAEDEFNVYVHTFDEDMDTTSLSEPEIKKTIGPGKLKDQTRDLPTPKQMREMFKEAGLDSETNEMDQVERDLFFAKVWKKPLEFVTARYPRISEDKIKKLKKIIKERE